MYLAELHGKLSSKIERMEDILTSNVFSFFKYSTRNMFLKEYLKRLNLIITTEEANEAEFLFWPHFEKGTEPDLVIIAGRYYLLFEAKYFSDFGKQNKSNKSQLIREIEEGILEAKNYKKEFKIIAITADYYFKKDKFTGILPKYEGILIWTNWQLVATFLNNVLESTIQIKETERNFANDLYQLLDKKKLRDFHGFDIYFSEGSILKIYSSIFLNVETTKYRGDFIGFVDSLFFEKKIKLVPKSIFLQSEKKIFSSLKFFEGIKQRDSEIFYNKR